MNSPIYPMTFIPKKRNFKLSCFSKALERTAYTVASFCLQKIRSGVLYEAVRLESMPERVA